MSPRVLTLLVSALAISACGGAPFTLETDDPSNAGSSSAGSSSSDSSSSGSSSSGSSSSGSSSSGSSSSEGGSSASADAGADAEAYDGNIADGNIADLWDGNLDTDAEVPEIGVCNFPGGGNIIVCDQWCPIPAVSPWLGYYATFACTDPGCACTIVDFSGGYIEVDGSIVSKPHLADGTVGSFVQLGEP